MVNLSIGGRALGSSFVKTFENLLSESKIQPRGYFSPCGLGSLQETLKYIKIKKIGNYNSLVKSTKFTPIFANLEL
jgi:hypothetical protein